MLIFKFIYWQKRGKWNVFIFCVDCGLEYILTHETKIDVSKLSKHEATTISISTIVDDDDD